ncbi:hypothetical protein MMC20_001656 [Loxospora ochrophaea]|nr:hypothetical protein [Loxospora ochrophaea]
MASAPSDEFNEQPNHEPNNEPFPWTIGVYDAHCHPTDTVSSMSSIPTMKARVLTIMATRSQDQDLVADFAAQLGLQSTATFPPPPPPHPCRVLPSFGWHPWFSHQLYDDTDPSLPSSPPDAPTHYRAILTPTPAISPPDAAFLSSLPPPTRLSTYLSTLRTHLLTYPHALIGEIGLDRSFRLPAQSSPSTSTTPGLTPGTRDNRPLTPFHVHLSHQKAIFRAQLRLAGELHRAVSVHGVGAHGVLFETLREGWAGCEKEVVGKKKKKKVKPRDLPRDQNNGDDHPGNTQDDHNHNANTNSQPSPHPPPPLPYPPRICLHSYSGPADTLRQYLHPSIPADIYFSFSRVINFSTPAATKSEAVISAVPADRLLVESDTHVAGERMDRLLEEMVRCVCWVKGWELEEGVRRLGENWRRWALGVEVEGVGSGSRNG